MKYLKIVVESFKIKGDPDDSETLQADVYERIQSMLEAETLAFHVDEDDEDEESDY